MGSQNIMGNGVGAGALKLKSIFYWKNASDFVNFFAPRALDHIMIFFLKNSENSLMAIMDSIGIISLLIDQFVDWFLFSFN